MAVVSTAVERRWRTTARSWFQGNGVAYELDGVVLQVLTAKQPVVIGVRVEVTTRTGQPDGAVRAP